MPTLPPLPTPPPANLLLFSSQQWRWLTDTIQAIYTAHEAEFVVLGTTVNALENLMATVQELQDKLDQNSAATDAAVQGINTEIQQLKDAIDALSTNQPPTQAQLDQLDAATAKLQAATAALAGDDPAAPSAR